MDFIVGAHAPHKSDLKSLKMREIPMFAKSQYIPSKYIPMYLENHMGRAQVKIRERRIFIPVTMVARVK